LSVITQDETTTEKPSRLLAFTGDRASTDRLLPLVTVVVIAVVIVSLTAGLVVTIVKLRSQESLNSLRTSAVAAATVDATDAASYNYKNLTGPGSPWSRLEANATPKFRTEFNSTSSGLSKLLVHYDATATGTVKAAGLSSITSSRAVVVLFVDQQVTNSVQKAGATANQPLRVVITLLRQHGRWMIDNLSVPT
jgi:Mce-associated membrane protein